MTTNENDETLMTAGQLAKRLERSTHGVKKAIKRLGILPERKLGGISFYLPTLLDTLGKEMRAANNRNAA